ncbi:NPCBM/NEW2 domain-containing protein [Streptomyces sp. NPDC051907]|uniref:NPCBM/NEW2 domain-containing protein n=1 Tax=Streptomyces sp. NPDC051907 TaxID=3155284 RepID=UPI0034227E28
MSSSPPPGDGIPPLPPQPPGPGPAPTPRRLGEVAALVSAVTAVIGLLLGFFGLPAVVNSPTARTVTVTETATVTAPPPLDTGDTATPSSPAPLPTGEVALRDLTPINDPYDERIKLRSATLKGKTYSNAMTFSLACNTSVEYSINERYKTLTLTVGLDDNGVATPGKLSIFGDETERKNVMLEINHPQSVTVDVSNVVKLLIAPDISDSGYCNGDGVVVALADAVLRS